MSINKMPKKELELMSYTDIAYEILKERKTGLPTKELFQKVCNLLDLSEKEFSDKVADFFASLTTDKRFVILEGSWELKERHSSSKIKVIDVYEDEESDEEEELSDEELIEEEIDEFAALDEDSDEDEIDDDEDDLEDLVIVDENELGLDE